MGIYKNKPKLLITGATGILGYTLCSVAVRSWETFGTMHHHSAEIPGVNMCRIDLTDGQSIVALFNTVRPDAVVHAAAISSPDYCQEHPDESEAMNVGASTYIAQQCAKAGIQCVFTSSDLVFDGEHAPYDEDSPPFPISIYGEQKLRAEAAMRACYPSTVICRLPLMFGVGSPMAPGPFVRMLRAMKKGQELRLFTDEIRTSVSTATAVHGIMMVLNNAQGNTLHLGGTERISRWEIGRIAAEVFHSNNACLVPCRQSDIDTPAPRPRDVSLNSSRAYKMGYQPRSILEQMQHIRTTMRGTTTV